MFVLCNFHADKQKERGEYSIVVAVQNKVDRFGIEIKRHFLLS